jgi:hypothetical protein
MLYALIMSSVRLVSEGKTGTLLVSQTATFITTKFPSIMLIEPKTLN